MTEDERTRLNISLLFLETIIDISASLEDAINELAWAAHSYVQSVALEAGLPDEEARELYARFCATQVIVEARSQAD